MIKEHLQFFGILLLGCDIKVSLICTQHLAYVILHNDCCKSRNIVEVIKQSHETVHLSYDT